MATSSSMPPSPVELFRKYHHEFCEALDACPSTLNSFTGKLYANKLIDRGTKREVFRKKGYEGADTLLDCLTQKLKCDKQNKRFKIILKLILEEENLNDIGEKMKAFAITEADAVLFAEHLKVSFEGVLKTFHDASTSTDVENLKSRLSVFFSPETESETLKKYTSVQDKIKACQTSAEILLFLCTAHFIGYLNFKLLKSFVKAAFPDHAHLESCLEEYNTECMKLFKCNFQSLIQLLRNPALSSLPPITLPDFTIRLGPKYEESNECTVRKFFEYRFLWAEDLLILDVMENCILIKYGVLPLFVSAVVRDLTDPTIIEELKKEDIIIELSPQLKEIARNEQVVQPPSSFYDSTISLSDVPMFLRSHDLAITDRQKLQLQAITVTDTAGDTTEAIDVLEDNQSTKFSDSQYGSITTSYETGNSIASGGQEVFRASNKERYVGLTIESFKSFMETLVSQARLIEDKLKKATMTLALDNFQVSDLPDVMSPLSSRPVSPCSSLYTLAANEEKFFPPALRNSKKEIAQTMNALIDMKESPSKLYISIKDLRDEVFLQSVHCNLLLAVVAGLPNCCKSRVIHETLEHILLTPANIHQEGSLQSYVENDLFSYGVVILGQRPFTNLIWLPESRSSMHMFAFGSVILYNSLLQSQQVELLDTKLKEGKRFKGFEDKSLDSHLHYVYDDLDILMSHCELNPEIRKFMPSGITAVNIIDAAFSHAIYDFLTIAARYCHRQFGFIFLDFNRDVHSLNEKPDIHGIEKHPGSRLFYLIQFAAVSYFSTNSTSSLIIALQHDDNLPDEEVRSGTAILEKAINDEIGRQNLPPDLIQDVLVINPDKKDDLMRFKIELEKFVRGRQSAFLDLKLAFVFFRSFLLNDLKYAQKIYVSFKEIQSLSQKLSIEKSELNVFLRTYTEFGSILYMKDILPDVVILQPAAFVNCIKKLFDHIAEGFTNGIISKSEAFQVLAGTNAVSVVIPFLIKSGLAVELKNSDICDQLQVTSSHFLFIPSVRPEYLENDHDPTSLYISYSSKITPPNMLGAFLQKMLKLGSLIPMKFQNLISLKLRNGVQLDIAFYPWLICVKLGLLNSRQQYEDTCKDILLQCISALSEIEVLFPDVTYDFALRCSFQKAITYEYILDNSESPRLCARCQHNLQHKKVRQSWSSAVKFIEQAKGKALVSIKTLTQITGKMATVKGVDDNLIMKVFSITAEEQAMLKATYYSDRHVYLLSILLTWVSKIGKDNVTKQKLFNNLFRASPQFINVL